VLAGFVKHEMMHLNHSNTSEHRKTHVHKKNWLDLTGKVVAVTGAASGIGLAIARELAQQGASLVLLDQHQQNLQDAKNIVLAEGGKVATALCDVADESQCLEAAKQSEQSLGPVSALINNAGVLRPGPLHSLSLNDWNTVLSVNLTGYLTCSRAFYEQLLITRGALVHIASISANFPQTNSGAYSAAKAGVLLLSRQMAAEWGPQGIRSNTVCPGMIRTPLSAKFYEEPGFEAKRAAMTASRRIGEPQDIANAVAFLVSERASYINGAQLDVDGAMSSMLMDMVPRPGYNTVKAKPCKNNNSST
jgi:glucose 1-dehydrogenase